jgi:nitrilase
VVLPEMFSFMGTDAERLATADSLNSGAFELLANLAKEHKIDLIGGSHSEISPTPNKVYNTCVSFNSLGEAVSVYRKIHLFNLWGPQGEKLFCESDVFEPGDKLAPFNLCANGENWHALPAICYDVRFPEVFRPLSSDEKPFDIIFLPAAFTHQTGHAHWELLVRARAVENQCFVVACNQTGTFLNGTKRNWGHSMIVDPWGEVVATMQEETGILWADISRESIVATRQKLPAWRNRRRIENCGG